MKYVLYFYIRIFRSMAVFYSSLISCFPDMLLRYCLSDFEMVPVAPIIIGITFAFTFHMRWISVMKFWYFKMNYYYNYRYFKLIIDILVLMWFTFCLSV